MMIKEDVRKVKKAAEMISKCKEEIDKVPLTDSATNLIFGIVCGHKRSFYHLFYDQPSHIDPLFMYLMPIERMDSFIDLLDVLSSATYASSQDGGALISFKQTKLSISSLKNLLKEFEDVLNNSFKSESNMVFYSWQSDLPNATNRNFIEDAINKAIKSVSKAYEYPLQLDKDTKERSGAPEIAKVIFEKIDMSMVFVADVSIVNTDTKGKKYPNPNVMLELGYALDVLGEENIILIMNTATGKSEDLPFDLRGKRIMKYECSDKISDDEKKEVKASLVKLLTGALKLVCKNNYI